MMKAHGKFPLLYAMMVAVPLVVAACQPQSDPAVVARVGDEAVTADEFTAKAAFMGLGTSIDDLPLELRRAVLQELIDRHLILAQAREKGIKLEPKDLKQTEHDLRSGMEPEAFRHNMLAQGIDYQQWQDELARELLMRKVLELVLTSKVRVDRQAIYQYHQAHIDQFTRPEQVLAQHTVLPSQQMAAQLVALMNQGMNMSEAMSKLGLPLSNDGRPDWLSRGHMPKDLEDKIFSLEPGKPAGPFHSDYGYHVVWVVRKREAAVVGPAEAMPQIQAELARARMEELAAAWLAELKNNTKIWVNPKFFDSAATGKRGELR